MAMTGTGVGGTVTLETAAGPAEFMIVGTTSNQFETAFYTPLATLERTLGQPTVLPGQALGFLAGAGTAVLPERS